MRLTAGRKTGDRVEITTFCLTFDHSTPTPLCKIQRTDEREMSVCMYVF